jgi:hypothetical protein
MMLAGWFKFHRAMMNHAVWSLPDAQFKVWTTILIEANHQERDSWLKGERVSIPAGYLIRSQRNLAEDARVSHQVVRDALRNLENMGSIRTHKRTQHKVMIEVVNWPTYQGSDRDENTEGNAAGTQEEHNENTTGRMRRMKARQKPSPASGLTLAQYLEKFSPEGQEVLRQTVSAIASTRESGKVSESVLNSLARKLDRYPSPVILQACRIYLAKNYASQGKAESYLLGIVRGEAKRRNGKQSAPESEPTSVYDDPRWPHAWQCAHCGGIHEGTNVQRGTCLAAQPDGACHA